MQEPTLLQTLQFAPRRSNHYARWAPIYLEPLVGSGERLCIAVAVVDSQRSIVYPVPSIERLTCVYGQHAAALVNASNLALGSIQRHLSKNGINFLSDWSRPMEGVEVGAIREGAGENLEDVARTALMQCASLAIHLSEESESQDPEAKAAESSGRLESMVKDIVIAARPELARFFGVSFKVSEKARPAYIGFAGHQLVANFGILVPGKLSPLVNNAKAKLWDLKQLKSGAMDGFFTTDSIMDFELLLHRPYNNDPSYSERQINALNAAALELEEEADKVDVRCRPMHSTSEIAKFVLSKEAA
ncbi:hypothetical protein [Duganella sp. S19_KUP01_CR8]|uniref:hypothetical protein n=1 Tax=Duganella sp. S19_KUP01_CR8 TaxID=3025502 RepID=UPI002FCDA52C